MENAHSSWHVFSCELGARRSTGCLSNKKHARRRGRRVSEFAVMNKRWHTRVQLRFCRATKPERSGTAQSQRSKIATRDAMSTQRYRRSVVHVTMPYHRVRMVVGSRSIICRRQHTWRWSAHGWAAVGVMEGGVLHCKNLEGRLSAGHCEVVDRGQARLQIDAKRYSREYNDNYGAGMTAGIANCKSWSKGLFHLSGSIQLNSRV